VNAGRGKELQGRGGPKKTATEPSLSYPKERRNAMAGKEEVLYRSLDRKTTCLDKKKGREYRLRE